MTYLFLNIGLLIGFLVVSFGGGILTMHNIISGVVVGLIVWIFASNAALGVKIQSLRDDLRELQKSIKNKKGDK